MALKVERNGKVSKTKEHAKTDIAFYSKVRDHNSTNTVVEEEPEENIISTKSRH